jgi:hypothetical protein
MDTEFDETLDVLVLLHEVLSFNGVEYSLKKTHGLGCCPIPDAETMNYRTYEVARSIPRRIICCVAV